MTTKHDFCENMFSTIDGSRRKNATVTTQAYVIITTSHQVTSNSGILRFGWPSLRNWQESVHSLRLWRFKWCVCTLTHPVPLQEMATSIQLPSDAVPFNIFASISMPPNDRYRGAVVEVCIMRLINNRTKLRYVDTPSITTRTCNFPLHSVCPPPNPYLVQWN